jgi:hypothetical protein
LDELIMNLFQLPEEEVERKGSSNQGRSLSAALPSDGTPEGLTDPPALGNVVD